MRISIPLIANELGYKLVGGTGKESFTNISIDSRTLKNNDLFVAIKGPVNDGHDYLVEAEEKGAIALVVEKLTSPNAPYILVEDSLKFLDKLGVYQRSKYQGKVVALTGSNGKTTTKEIIYSILKDFGCHKTVGNQNNHIGVPLSLGSLNNDKDYAVIEIGTNSPGEINQLSKQVKPNIGLILNAAASHLERLDSVEKVAEEKSAILDNIKEGGTAILPRDSMFFSYWKDKCFDKKIVTFGSHQDSDIRFDQVRMDLKENKVTFDLFYEDKNKKCVMNGIAMHNSYNACAALAVGHVLNLDLEELSLNLNNISYPARRMEIKNALNDALLIDDSYNANPESMKRSLDFLDSIKGKNRIFVAGEMGELGTHKESFHIDICNYAKHRVEEFLCIGGLWDEGIKRIPKIGSKFSSKDDLLDYLNTKLAKNSVILVKGSRSSRMDYISDKLMV